MTYHCGLSYEAAWSMPVQARKWWIKRTAQQKEKERKAAKEKDGQDSAPPNMNQSTAPWNRKP